ncbi:hypothetical protein FOZ60_008356 [Perkinsus olseni]|uniref:RRM domain-containing protein n=1 Tax=Perkinsus olseni TaxID=32597 RepID=A0A7J6NKF6_PEROL|nr:hypothetical protein FOZ60_008356 [Perkinsus olseni]
MASQEKCVYVGNLDWTTTEDELGDYMKKVGDVVSVEILTRHDGKSKGCGIVEFKETSSVTKAIDTLNETQLGERKIFVREDRGPAKPSSETGNAPLAAARVKVKERVKGKGYWDWGYDWGFPGKGKGFKGYKGKGGLRPLRVGPRDKGRLIYVGNLPWRTAWQDLKDLFRECGEVIRVDIAEGWDGRSKGFATVLFEDEESTAKAIEKYNEYEFQGRKLLVREDKFVQ